MNEFKKIAPETSKIKKELPFKVPKNYFDDFSARLQFKLHEETDLPEKNRSGIIRYLKPALGLAASFLLIIILVYWPISTFLPQYLARTQAVHENNHEEDLFFPSVEAIDENAFYALIIDVIYNDDEPEVEYNDEDLLSYLGPHVSDYEIFLETEN